MRYIKIIILVLFVIILLLLFPKYAFLDCDTRLEVNFYLSCVFILIAYYYGRSCGSNIECNNESGVDSEKKIDKLLAKGAKKQRKV